MNTCAKMVDDIYFYDNTSPPVYSLECRKWMTSVASDPPRVAAAIAQNHPVFRRVTALQRARWPLEGSAAAMESSEEGPSAGLSAL